MSTASCRHHPKLSEASRRKLARVGAGSNDVGTIQNCRKRVEESLPRVGAVSNDVATIQNCRKRVEESLARVGAGSLSCKSIKEITHNLLVTDKNVAETIFKWKNDVFHSEELHNLVKEYFRGNLLTIEVVTELENCLGIVDNSHFLLVVAIQEFIETKKYAEVVEKLEKFKANGDPFKKRFWALYIKACEQQKSLLEKVEHTHAEVVKRRETIKAEKARRQQAIDILPWMFFGLFFPVVPLVMFLPVFGGLNETLLRQIFSSVEQEHEQVVMEEQFTKTMMGSTICVITDLENIGVLVESSTEMIKSLSGQADEVLEDEDAMELIMGMDRMKTQVDMFRRDIVQLTTYTQECKNDILRSREKILALK